jgi:hypothetical protein
MTRYARRWPSLRRDVPFLGNGFGQSSGAAGDRDDVRAVLHLGQAREEAARDGRDHARAEQSDAQLPTIL